MNNNVQSCAKMDKYLFFSSTALRWSWNYFTKQLKFHQHHVRILFIHLHYCEYFFSVFQLLLGGSFHKQSAQPLILPLKVELYLIKCETPALFTVDSLLPTISPFSIHLFSLGPAAHNMCPFGLSLCPIIFTETCHWGRPMVFQSCFWVVRKV